jgi:DNA-binding NarL/FixJ family response regulator
LSEREREVLDLIAEEQLTNREIAERLTIEEGTVAVHVHHILKKLHCRTRQQAARLKLAYDKANERRQRKRGREDER